MKIEGKEYEIKMNRRTYHCSLDVTMDFIGGKWKTIVLWYLRKGPKRFGELKKLIPDITEKMLSIQLKTMENAGLIERKLYPEVPPRVEYFFTEEGKTIIPVLEAMAEWGIKKAHKEGRIVEKI